MFDEINLGIAGVSLLTNVIFQLLGQQSRALKCQLVINRVLINHNSVAMNLSLSNATSKPFSILNMFIQQQDKVYEGCRLINVDYKGTSKGCEWVNFYTDTGMFQYKINDHEALNLNPFNIHAYLIENQAETGWMVFKVPQDAQIINKVGVKISGTTEILYANP